MGFRVVVFIALRQLWARRVLNGIAVLGVTLGVLVLIGINGIMQGFQQKFLQNILKISPHATIFDKQLRPAPPLLARFTDSFVATRVHHEVPSDRQLRISRPSEVIRALERLPGVESAAGLLVGSAVIAFEGHGALAVDAHGRQLSTARGRMCCSKRWAPGLFRVGWGLSVRWWGRYWF